MLKKHQKTLKLLPVINKIKNHQSKIDGFLIKTNRTQIILPDLPYNLPLHTLRLHLHHLLLERAFY